MADRLWEKIKTIFCNHAGCEVHFEVEVIYPAEWMPDQPPRVLAHRCSHGVYCRMQDKASCIWAGTNPVYNPFLETQE